VERWIQEFGLETTKGICIYDQSVPGTVIRLRDRATEQQLLAEGVKLAPGTLLSRARRVLSGHVTRAKAFLGKHVAIQDEASQLVGLLTGRGSRVLDCCAAPGGKTAILAERNPESTITAVELHQHRARLLRRLVPAGNVRVVAGDIRKLPLAGQFDRVLADVPCSGTGTLARNPDIKWRLKPEDLVDLERRQLAILQSAMTPVAVGGTLVYSTCSLEREENSSVVEEVLVADRKFTLLDVRGQLQRLQNEGELVLEDIDSILDGKYLRIIPGMHETDGFFAAMLQRI
jgi:16S rRNA (cytosine967-C5)-methyltransferase